VYLNTLQAQASICFALKSTTAQYFLCRLNIFISARIWSGTYLCIFA
jgi:hypothetical protein